MRNKFSKLAFSAAFVLALAFIFSCSSDDNPSNSNQPNINSGSEISSSGGGGNGSSSSSYFLGQSSSAVLKECDAIFNPDNKFCYDGNVYDKCDGMLYDPASQICENGVATPTKCNGNGENYNPLTQICCGSSAILSNSTTEICTNNIVETRCGNNWYKQTTQFCYEGIVYDKCNGLNNYNPSTQACVTGDVVETKCGGNWYSQRTQFCVDSRIYNKCDGMVYPLASHICVNNVATPAKCGNESYNPLTQFCGNGIVKTYDSVTYQGQTYRTTVIGTQTWMAENLNYNVSGSKCNDNNESNCTTYGRLYDWVTAMKLPASCNSSSCASSISAKHQGICPTDWHIPSHAEWIVLVRYAGSSSDSVGKQLKVTSGWNENGNGTNDYGFSALPGGGGYSNGNFYSVGRSGGWLSASEYDWGASEDNAANMVYTWWIGDDVAWIPNEKSVILFSVRCVKD